MKARGPRGCTASLTSSARRRKQRSSAISAAPFQFGIYEGKRRVVFFGSRYDFTHQRLEAAEELPAWLVSLAGHELVSRHGAHRFEYFR
jgi:hypothetical protein